MRIFSLKRLSIFSPAFVVKYIARESLRFSHQFNSSQRVDQLPNNYVHSSTFIFHGQLMMDRAFFAETNDIKQKLSINYIAVTLIFAFLF